MELPATGVVHDLIDAGDWLSLRPDTDADTLFGGKEH